MNIYIIDFDVAINRLFSHIYVLTFGLNFKACNVSKHKSIKILNFKRRKSNYDNFSPPFLAIL